MANTRLTWQNVSTPDFSGAANAQRVAAESFDRAIGRIGDGLTHFDETRKNAGDAAIIQNMMRYQDADALQAAIASGALTQGVDPAAVRASTLLKAQDQVGNLLDLGTKRQKLATDKQSFDFNELDNPLKIARSTQINAEADYTFNRLKDANERADTQRVAVEQATQRWTGMLQNGQLDSIEDQNRLYSSLNTQDPADRALMGLLVQKRPDLATPAMLGTASSVSGGSGGIAATSGAPAAATSTAVGTAGGSSSWNRLVGGGTADLSGMKIGQWEDTLANDLITKTKGTSIMDSDVRAKGSSASGRYQVTRDTLRSIAPTVLGKDYRDMTFTPEVQEKLGKHLYDSRVGNKSNMTDEWRGLRKIAGADKAGAWDGIPWEAARNVIAQFESGDAAVLGKNPTMEDVRKYAASASLDRSTEALVSDVTQSANQWGNSLAGGPDSQRYITASKLGTSPANVKLDLMKAFPALDTTELSKGLDYVMTQAKVPAPLAAEILKNTPESESWFGFGKPKFDASSLDRAIEQYQATYGAKLKDGLLSDAMTKRDTEQATEYQAGVDAAKALVSSLTAQVKHSAGLPRQAVLQRELDAANASYRDQLLAQRTHSEAVKANADKVIAQGTKSPPPPLPIAKGKTSKEVPAEIRGLTPDKIKAMGREEVRTLISNPEVMRAASSEMQQALMMQFSMAQRP